MPLRALVVALVVATLASCTPVVGPTLDREALDADLDAAYPYLEEPLTVAWRHAAGLHYFSDDEVGYWQSPHETESRGGGDCEDIATVLVYMLGREASRVSVYKLKTGTYHSVVWYKERYIEAQVYGRYLDSKDFDVRKVYSYEVVMRASTANGRK